jgi:hypothetical protein
MAIMSFVLSTGAKMPTIGFGTWQIDPDLVGNAVYAAVKVGAQHPLYPLNPYHSLFPLPFSLLPASFILLIFFLPLFPFMPLSIIHHTPFV